MKVSHYSSTYLSVIVFFWSYPTRNRQFTLYFLRFANEGFSRSLHLLFFCFAYLVVVISAHKLAKVQNNSLLYEQHKRAHTHTEIDQDKSKHTHARTHIHTNRYIHIHTHMSTFAHAHSIYTHINTHTPTHTTHTHT